MKHKILYLFVAVAMLSACGDDLENQNFTISEEKPVATWLSENGYTSWTSLLEYTGLFSTINLDAGNYTVFVPDNDAVSEYLAENQYSSIQDIDKDYAKLLVKYHTIAGKQYSQVDFANDVLPDTTANGDRLTVTFDDMGEYYVNSTARISHFDIEATNGTIFIIDEMLVPITEYLYDNLSANDDWSLFRELLAVTEVDSLIMKPKFGRATNYSLFVVSDSVYAANGINDITALADSLEAGHDRAAWKELSNPMYRYAAYHLVSTVYSTADLATESVKTVETKAEASFLEFQELNGVAYVNYNKNTQTGAEIIEGNITCKNGVIHVVSTPLYIKAPSKAPSITWDLCDYDVLARNIDNYRLTSLSATKYHGLSGLKELYGEEFCYNWESVVGGSVYYEVAASTDTLRKAFRYNDALNIDLGQYGWVEMETPTIMADNTLYYIGIAHLNSYANEPGNYITVYVDGEKVGEMPTCGNSVTESSVVTPSVNTSKPANNKHVVGSVVFETTGKHIIRIEDNNGADLELDYILFTPKN